ncbi:MAG: LarC family nickel insertion protein, partial [Candidatus Wallbacteria bacterium]|nr:LarC family nickel insertion protein [Candidatus Wallbacteria bacterium]
MNFIHFDIFAGISGDMILGSLVDCGLDARRLAEELERMDVPRFELTARKVARGEMSGTQVAFELPAEDAHRGLRDIEKLVSSAPYSDWVKTNALAIFRRIAEAESLIHQMKVEEIHFHEIGAMDSILDVTGAVLGLELLGIKRVTSTSVPLGRGTVEAAHGTMPVPAPATLEV